jgi:hypothetical protein
VLASRGLLTAGNTLCVIAATMAATAAIILVASRGRHLAWPVFLVIARQADSTLPIAAQTLPEENALTTILRKPGFRLLGSVHHPEDGEIWEWRL